MRPNAKSINAGIDSQNASRNGATRLQPVDNSQPAAEQCNIGRRRASAAFAALCLLPLAGCGGGGGGDGSGSGTSETPSTPAPAPGAEAQPSSIAYRLHGLDFSPYGAGQDPNRGAVVDEAELTAKMEIVKSHTTWIRTFGSTQGLERAGAVARRLGLRTALSAWVGRDSNANERELQNLVSAAKAGEADLLIVGSEALLRGDATESQLLAYIDRVRKEVPGIPVSYADTYAEILAHPGVVAAVDVVLVNYHPFWERIRVENAVAAIHGWHSQIVAVAKGKPVMVSEAGWPSDGNAVGDAIPSAANASFFFLNFVSWARANTVSFFYFEAFDEPWKAAYEGPQGAHWGIWDQFGNLKPGMERVFNGETMPDNWSTTVPSGPGQPVIEFTSVPRFGSFDDLKGRVLHVDPTAYKVAVYIYVRGWWTKPFFLQPLTTIQRDGSWICDITTGGIDEQATAIAAFLVPNGYSPPLLSGAGSFPADLVAKAVARIEVSR